MLDTNFLANLLTGAKCSKLNITATNNNNNTKTQRTMQEYYY